LFNSVVAACIVNAFKAWLDMFWSTKHLNLILQSISLEVKTDQKKS